jgi:hexokinase
MDTLVAKRSLRVRASAEAFEVLRTNANPLISRAELLKHAVRNGQEPHPRVVRDVYQALLAVREAQPRKPTSALHRISGIFSRNEVKSPAIDEIVSRFEEAFSVRTDARAESR